MLCIFVVLFVDGVLFFIRSECQLSPPVSSVEPPGLLVGLDIMRQQCL